LDVYTICIRPSAGDWEGCGRKEIALLEATALKKKKYIYIYVYSFMKLELGSLMLYTALRKSVSFS
jgi:hypothetical protein